MYEPLNDAEYEIRLLSILPAPSIEDNIECSLTIVSLRDSKLEYGLLLKESPLVRREELRDAWWRSKVTDPELASQLPSFIPPAECFRFKWGDFAAFSYTWGDTKDVEIIILDGVDTPVTTNVAAALRTFRQLNFFGHGYKLWVDSICINQQDLDERSSQVAMMREIYAQSWTTMSFLGPAADESDKALKLLRDLAWYTVNQAAGKLRDILHDDPGFLGGHGEWIALQTLLQRPYWSRLWVVQEIALAPSNMPMFAGSEFVTWRQVQDALRAIHNCHWYVKDVCLEYDRRKVLEAQGIVDGEVDGSWDTENLHHITKGPGRLAERDERGEAITMANLLEVACATTCKESLDKVYGLLSFFEPVIADQIVVEYRLEPSQLFSQVAQVFISHYSSLEILRDGNPWNRTKTPSWAPDWTWEYRSRDKLSPYLAYNADGATQSEVSFSTDGRLLTVRGVIVDSVPRTVSKPTIDPKNEDNSVSSDEQVCKFCSAYGDPSATRVALYRALTGARVEAMGHYRTEDGRDMQIFNLPVSTEVATENFKERAWVEFSIQGNRYEAWEEWRRANDDMDLGDLGRVGDFFTDLLPEDANQKLLWSDYRRFRNVAQGRTFVTTSRGRFSWVPADLEGTEEMKIQPGDLFCIVFGCSVPLVIRPVGQNYQILGESYLQGYMEGEILEAIDAKEIAAENITFC